MENKDLNSVVCFFLSCALYLDLVSSLEIQEFLFESKEAHCKKGD